MSVVDSTARAARPTRSSLRPPPPSTPRPDPGRLILEALPYVRNVARGFQGRGLDVDELVAAGNLGLMQAATRFDPRREVKFTTYASWWIRKAIHEALQEQAGPVRLPRYQLERLRTLQESRTRLRLRGGEEPDRDALARESGLSRETVEQLSLLVPGTVSLEPLLGMLAAPRSHCPQSTALRRNLAGLVRRLLVVLEPREREVLCLRFGLSGSGMTLRQTGHAMGISRESVRQLEQRALSKLRARLHDTGGPARPAVEVRPLSSPPHAPVQSGACALPEPSTSPFG